MKLPEINPNQSITLDLETCDPELKELAPGYITKHGFVAGIAIAVEEGSWYIPINHARGENYDEKEVVEWLNKICSADTDKVFHNAQYDLGWLKYMGVELHGHIFDTMLAAPLLDENRRNYSLDSLGKTYFGEGKNEVALQTAVEATFGSTYTHKTIVRFKDEKADLYKYEPFLKAREKVTQLYDLWPQCIKDRYEVVGHITDKRGHEVFKLPLKTQASYKGLLWAVDPELMGSYPIQDVDLTRRLCAFFKNKISGEKLDEVMALENELLPCLLEMREQGVRIDLQKAIKLDKEYTVQINETQKKIDDIAKFPVNVDAETDLVTLCDTLCLTYERTPKGNPCFSAEKVPDHEVFQDILSMRKLKKLRDTYIRGYFFGLSINGRLHGQYNQLKSDDGGTVTGRLSSSGPNLQNIPARGEAGPIIRSLFLPDSDEERWLCMDFSGQEPKMLVNLVLLLDKKFGTRQVTDLCTGEVTLVKEEGFPGANLARQPEFSSREADFHTAVARRCMEQENKVNNVTVTEEELQAQAKGFRSKAKSIGLGIMYGSGDDKVAEEMTKKGAPMNREQAGELRANVYAAVPFLNAVNKYVMDIAKRRGYVLTLLKRRGRFNQWEIPVYGIKRTSYTPLLFSSQRDAQKWLTSPDRSVFEAKHPAGQIGRPQRAFTYKALNKIIQGSSADQTKTAMLHIYKRGKLDVSSLDIYYRRELIPPKMRVQVHDELNFSIEPDADIKWYQQTMENSLPLMVESVAEPGIGACWAEAK